VITSPLPNLYESSDGFFVEVLGFTDGLLDGEGPKRMRTSSEILASGPRLLALWNSSITRWDPPHDAEVVSPSDRERIIENVRAAFRSDGHEIAVI
jgi:immunity protein 74 of polymorphic toxin system